MKVISNTVRYWLIKNNYKDVAEIIDGIIVFWQKNGNGTRRNWWDKLAGGKNGVPLKVNGIEIPVLKAAQIRQGKPVTENAICRNENEIITIRN